MMSIAEALEEYFKQENWKYQKIDDNSFTFSLKSGTYTYGFVARIDEKNNLLMVHATLPIIAPREKLPMVAEFLNRVNYSMPHGNFILDFDDGEVCNKQSFDFMDYLVKSDVIDRIIINSFIGANIFIPYLEELIDGDMTPKQAYEKAMNNLTKEVEKIRKLEIVYEDLRSN